MPPPRRKLHATAAETVTPPDTLAPGQLIARVVKAEGKNLYTVTTAPSSSHSSTAPPSADNSEHGDSTTLLVELEARFRSTIWLKRGSYVLVDTGNSAERENKIDGRIVNVVRDEKAWRRERYWPVGFTKDVKRREGEEDSEEESRVGKMPPSESESEGEEGEENGS